MKFSVKWNEWEPRPLVGVRFKESDTTVYDDYVISEPRDVVVWACYSIFGFSTAIRLRYAAQYLREDYTIWSAVDESDTRQSKVLATFTVTKLEE